MAVKIIITSSRFYNQFKNGVNFTDNPSDHTNNLAGSVMENIKLIYEIEISWGISYASDQFDWDLTTSGTTLVITWC